VRRPAQVRMQAAATAVQAQAVAATTGASPGSAGKAAAASGVRRYPNARAAYGIILRRAPWRGSKRRSHRLTSMLSQSLAS